jgi:hypothetical protein
MVTQVYSGDVGVVLMAINEIGEVTLGEVRGKKVKGSECWVASCFPKMHKSTIQVATWESRWKDAVEDGMRQREG